MDFRWLGRIGYPEGLALQNDLVNQRQRGEIGDTLLCLEHNPVYTIGRTRDRSSLLDPENLPYPVVETNRGDKPRSTVPGSWLAI